MAHPAPSKLLSNTPDFGKNVIILDVDKPNELPEKYRSMKMISDSQTQDGAEFAQDRYAFILKRGTYATDIEVGYYMTVHGLGQRPDDVVVDGDVKSPGSKNPETPAMALNNFWRGVENIGIKPKTVIKPENQDPYRANVWAVSQATFMRRTHIIGGRLHLFDTLNKWPWAGYASGGFIADCVADQLVDAGSQQQFLTRNTTLLG
jgi:hypothetical protein